MLHFVSLGLKVRRLGKSRINYTADKSDQEREQEWAPFSEEGQEGEQKRRPSSAYVCHKWQVPAWSLCTDHSNHISNEPQAQNLTSSPHDKHPKQNEPLGFSDDAENHFMIQELTVAKKK